MEEDREVGSFADSVEVSVVMAPIRQLPQLMRWSGRSNLSFTAIVIVVDSDVFSARLQAEPLVSNRNDQSRHGQGRERMVHGRIVEIAAANEAAAIRWQHGRSQNLLVISNPRSV